MNEIEVNATEPIFGSELGKVKLKVHDPAQCEGRPCVIHHPSAHHMRDWPLHWRSDTGVMERTCPHGVGHPDPDHLAYVLSVSENNKWQGVHGCDSCCLKGNDNG